MWVGVPACSKSVAGRLGLGRLVCAEVVKFVSQEVPPKVPTQACQAPEASHASQGQCCPLLLATNSCTLAIVRMEPPAEVKGTKHRTQNLLRTTEFWRRAAGIYLSYKTQQVNAWRLRRQGWSADRLRDELWQPHHTWAGAQSDASWHIHFPSQSTLGSQCYSVSQMVTAQCGTSCRRRILSDGCGSAGFLPQGGMLCCCSSAGTPSCAVLTRSAHAAGPVLCSQGGVCTYANLQESGSSA